MLKKTTPASIKVQIFLYLLHLLFILKMNSQRVSPYVIKDQSFTTLSSGKTSRFKRTSNQNSRSKSHSNRQNSTELSKFYVKNPFHNMETPQNNCDQKGFKQIKDRIFQSSTKSNGKETVKVIKQKFIELNSPQNNKFNPQEYRKNSNSIKSRTLSGYQAQRQDRIEYLNSNPIYKTEEKKEFSLQVQYYQILRQNQTYKEQNRVLKNQLQQARQKLLRKQQCLKCNQAELKYEALKGSFQNALHDKYERLTKIEILQEKLRKYQKQICDVTRKNQKLLHQIQEMQINFDKQMNNSTKNNNEEIQILKKSYIDCQQKNKLLEQIVNQRSNRQKKKLIAPEKIQLKNSSQLFYLTDSDGLE